jgi:hypothetical protein
MPRQHANDSVGGPARSRRPPGVDGPVGAVRVGGDVAEQVDRKRLGGQQVGPQALVVEDLVRLDERSAARAAATDLVVRNVAHAVSGGVEVEAAADQARRRPRAVPMGLDWLPIDLMPARVVELDTVEAS